MSTANPGEMFALRIGVWNDGGAAIDVPVILPQLPDITEQYWVIEKSSLTVTSDLEGTGLYGANGINDVLHLPYGTSAIYVVGVKVPISTPIGTEFVMTATIDGNDYSETLSVRRDEFIDERYQTNQRQLLSVMFGNSDATGQDGVTKMQDMLNNGLRLHHLFKDLADRRGYPDRVGLCGITELSPDTLGEGGARPARTYPVLTFAGLTVGMSG